MSKIFLCGPSHLRRMIREVDDGVLPNYYDFKFWGRGGLPIFSKRLYDLIEIYYNKGYEVCLMVPDFRFGNRIFNDYKKFQIPYFSDDYRMIDKSLINKSNDEYLYQNMLYIVNKLLNDFPRIQLMFWDLFIREQENKLNNKYVDRRGIYRHPIWNYTDIENYFYKNMIDIKIIDKNFKSYIIDQQGHPSLKGQIFILSSFYTKNPKNVYSILEDNYHKSLNSLFKLTSKIF